MDLRAHSLIGVLMLVVTTCHHASCSSNEPSIIIKAGGGPKVESAKEQLGESESSIRLSQLETLKHSNNELSGSSDPSAITSIHRVWTASSSGSLDELSPQMISKLRRDVPFLAAYALRPRLVGGQQAVSSQLVASPSSRRLQSVMAPGGGTLVPRLGDFSEFSVDVSSKSTSEHHHRRKTSLKRKDRQQRRARKMDSFLEELKLANKRRKANGRVDALNTDGKRIKGRKNSRRLRSGRSGRKSSMSKRVQFGRQSLANGTRSDSGLKGASEATSGPDKTPFFASVRPEGKGAKSESASEPSDSNGANSIDIAEQTTRSPNETPIDADYEDNEPDAHADSQSDSESEEPEPRRVGDGDVEAEGDTVTVTPKFDGIDDDPELEPEEADEPSEGTSGVAGGGGIGATSGGGGPTSDTLGPAEDEVSSSPKHKSATGDVEPGVEFADASADGESARGGSNFGVRSKETGREDDASLDNDDDDDEEAGGTIDPQHRTGGSGGQGAAGTHSRKGSELGSDDADCRSHAHDDDGHYEHGHDHDDESNERPRRAKSHQDKIDWLRKSIPGEPGADYPILSRVNVTNFNCRDYPWPGFYADVDSDCQVFHICQADGRQDSFLCPNGTVFSQSSRVCVWWNSFQCEDAPKYYERNSQLYKQMTNLRPPTMEMREPEQSSSHDGTTAIDKLIKTMKRARNGGPGDNNNNDDDDDGASTDAQHGTTRDSQLGKRVSLERELQPGNGIANANANGSVNRNGIAIGNGAERDVTDQRRGTTSNTIKGDNEDDDQESARLRRRPNGNRRSAIERRRRRRASIRQAPPKLKSRRVMRNSKRRMRHGVKPKRRA